MSPVSCLWRDNCHHDLIFFACIRVSVWPYSALLLNSISNLLGDFLKKYFLEICKTFFSAGLSQQKPPWKLNSFYAMQIFVLFYHQKPLHKYLKTLTASPNEQFQTQFLQIRSFKNPVQFNCKRFIRHSSGTGLRKLRVLSTNQHLLEKLQRSRPWKLTNCSLVLVSSRTRRIATKRATAICTLSKLTFDSQIEYSKPVSVHLLHVMTSQYRSQCSGVCPAWWVLIVGENSCHVWKCS